MNTKIIIFSILFTLVSCHRGVKNNAAMDYHEAILNCEENKESVELTMGDSDEVVEMKPALCIR